MSYMHVYVYVNVDEAIPTYYSLRLLNLILCKLGDTRGITQSDHDLMHSDIANP